jgi:hypothetical protein
MTGRRDHLHLRKRELIQGNKKDRSYQWKQQLGKEQAVVGCGAHSQSDQTGCSGNEHNDHTEKPESGSASASSQASRLQTQQD